jgi:hypothetical protein
MSLNNIFMSAFVYHLLILSESKMKFELIQMLKQFQNINVNKMM